MMESSGFHDTLRREIENARRVLPSNQGSTTDSKETSRSGCLIVTRSGDNQAPGTPAGRANPGRANPERANPERANPERANPGRANPGRANPGRANPGRANPGRANPGRANPGRANPGRANPERANPERANPERANPERANPERANPERANPERANPERANPERANPERANPERANPERANPERANPERAARPPLRGGIAPAGAWPAADADGGTGTCRRGGQPPVKRQRGRGGTAGTGLPGRRDARRPGGDLPPGIESGHAQLPHQTAHLRR
ncbi:hypothetical protein [Kitasatospora sp. NBC_01287]|uniref:hypothetical protein n=1 Tax=Kitasatospora sp. NBC_01287 TaxID=2903573 RepID=UPI00338F347F